MLSYKVLMDIYHRLYSAAGPQHWWPASSSFEMIIGALLTQNTAWRNVERALDNLSRDISPEDIFNMPLEELEAKIRPCGYFHMKASRLKGLADWCIHWGYTPREFLQIDTQTLRNQLLSIKGVGRETADSILLYGLDKPIFVVDAYTRRMLARFFGNEEFLVLKYDDVADIFHTAFEKSLPFYQEFHALIVHLCTHYCLKSAPLCSKCPLSSQCCLVDSGNKLY